MDNKVNENKKKKPIKTIVLVSAIVVTLIIFGDFANFGRSHVSILEKKTCEINSRVKAKSYIKNKYGFTPKINNVNVYIRDKMFSSSKYGEDLGGARVYAEYNGTLISIFTPCVFSSNLSTGKTIVDDYQKEEAERYMDTYLYDKTTEIANSNKNIIDYRVRTKEYTKPLGYHDYFDINNLSEEYLYLLGNLDIVFEGENGPSKNDMDDIKNIGHGVIKIYNVKSKKEYEKYMEDKLESDDISLPAYLLYSETSNIGSADGKFNTTYYNTITENNISLITGTTTKEKILEPVSLAELQEIISSNPSLQLRYSYVQAYRIIGDGYIYAYVPSETLKTYNLADLRLSHWRSYPYNNTTNYSLDYNESLLLSNNLDDYIYYPIKIFNEGDIIIFSR